MTLPAIPKAPVVDLVDDVYLRRAGLEIIAWADEEKDPARLIQGWEELRPWDQVLKHLAAEGKDTTPMRAALRWAEVRIGQEDPRPGRGARTDLTSWSDQEVDSFRGLELKSRSEFRRLADHTEIVQAEIADACSLVRDEENRPEWAVLLRKAVQRLTRRHLLKIVAEQAHVERNLPPGDEEGDDWRLLAGDLNDRLPELADGSIDLILTDPPYPKDDLPLYGRLAHHAARLLKPQGVLLAYAGKMYLPEIFRWLDRPGLQYGWEFTLSLGSESRILGRHIMQTTKPILAYSRGPWPSGEWISDHVAGAGRDKSGGEEYKQATTEVLPLIERFTAPGGVVLDPFAGLASFGIAALSLDRKFVGVEIDRGRFEQAAAALRS